MDLVKALNEGLRSLDDILVLRVEGGRDHFIPVKANWLNTSLGRSIDKLIRIPEGGIRRLQKQRPGSSKSRSRGDSGAGSGRASPAGEQPVRFSAPRELFRLTEAVEAMATRVIAEWDMICSDDSGQSAPWMQNPGWPFDEQCWTERESSHWEYAMSEACNALDDDQPLESNLPQDLPRMQQLYILSSFLLLFLKSLPDGVIMNELWAEVDMYFSDQEKVKRKPTNEEQRMAIQEILSQSPSHSISFILVTSMLDHILQEISGTRKAKDEPTLSPSGRKHGGTLRRMTGTFSKLPAVPHEEQAVTAWAHIFADVLVRMNAAKKVSSTQERRRRGLIEGFLRKSERG